jgi:hypothetical protein
MRHATRMVLLAGRAGVSAGCAAKVAAEDAGGAEMEAIIGGPTMTFPFFSSPGDLRSGRRFDTNQRVLIAAGAPRLRPSAGRGGGR